MRTRVLTRRERQIIVDALLRAATETRKARHEALVETGARLALRPEHLQDLSVLAHTQERLARELRELGEGDVRIEAVLT